ncbi:amino acid adenylation domain-containing protein [Paracoccus halophilus]|uniref:Amino acid adenylation domain-containing protein n=1 Tax=Paracoccus halophilus TaxID=376733 RepID=A0A1I0TYU7_9RHOB|nr:non-ribosomal peptide synthetase [Paracoccus halophilus]SFA56837.1 amino acid adenylation domain-containing protein [Paracoccus halophilus]
MAFVSTSPDTDTVSRKEALAQLLRNHGKQHMNIHPVSRGQQALWFLHQSRPDSPAYTVVFALRIRSALDKAALRSALQVVVDRHQQLRANFRMGEDGKLVQMILGYRTVTLPETQVGAEQDLDATLRRAAAAPFDLETDPLFRPQLFTLGKADHVLLLCVHHVIFDGWSLWLTLDELRIAYEAAVHGRQHGLPVPQKGYIEHIERQERMINGPRGAELATYWTNNLQAARGTLDLPFDAPRPPVRQLGGASHSFALSPELTAQLQGLARELGITLFSLLLGAYQIFIARYSRQQTIPIGTRSAGRNDPEMMGVVGYFVNPVVVVSDLQWDQPVGEVLRNAHEQATEALSHDELPFPVIVEKMKLQRDPSVTPLFQTSFVMQKAQRAGGAMEIMAAHQNGRRALWAGLEVEYIDLPQQTGQFDLDLEMFEVGEQLQGVLKYDTALFLPESITRLADNFTTMLQALVVNPDQQVDDLPIVSAASRELIEQFSRPGAAAIEAVECVHESFQRQVAADPEAPALTCEGVTLSYDQLNRRANRLAHRLIAAGVLPGDLVGFCTDRSLEMMIGLLAILKAGAAYLPIDPSLPAERVNFIMQDSKSSRVLIQNGQAAVVETAGAELIEMGPNGEIEGDWPEADPENRASLDGLIYVMYTSGTTGRPKGVQLTHRNVARLFLNTQCWFEFNRNDVWTLFHSFAFDFSVWEMWGALIYGGRLVVVPYLVSRSPSLFVDLVRREGVTILNQSPSAFKLFVAEEGRSGAPQSFALRAVVFGGEPLDLQSLRPWVSRHGDQQPLLVNMYGITEITVHASYRVIRAADLTRTRSPIGVAIPDLRLDLLDHRLRPVPIGATGEIHVSGPGLASGYLGRPELTADKFVTGSDKVLYYRSSDLGRYLPDGDIEYLGRNDKQVKIRGFRIELGEIESSLCRHPGVRTAVTVTQDHPSLGKRLVSYVVPKGNWQMDERDLRNHLADSLPDYMIPAVLMQIDEVPLNGNGKVDHARLPEAETNRDETQAFVASRNSEEAALTSLWERVLGMSPIGVNDDFFRLGGQSLLAVHLMSEIGTAYGRKLPTALLFRNPTIAQMAQALRQGSGDEWSPLVPMNDAADHLPAIFCVAGGGGSTLYYQSMAAALEKNFRFFGLQLRGTDGLSRPHETVEDVADELVRALTDIQPQGPYRLAGHCFGGVVAFEMARRLEARGDTVERLVIMDAPAPVECGGQLNNIEHDDIDDADWLAKIAEVLAESAEMDLRIAADQIRQSADPLTFTAGKIASAGLLPIDAARDHLKGFINVFQANSRARYRPANSIAADVTLLRAAQAHPDYDYSASEVFRDPAAKSSLGWNGLSSGHCQVHFVPGTHLTMLSSGNTASISEAMRLAMES